MKEPKGFTILVVDDEEALRKAIAFDFKRKGYKVLEAGSGNQAFEIVRKTPVDLILTDIRMPDGDGVSLLKRTKEADHATPIVMFITGFADLSLEDAYDQGADAVFSKPFERKALMDAVAHALKDKEEVWSQSPERLATDWSIDLQVEGGPGFSAGRVIHVGRGGLFVALPESLPRVGAKICFKIGFSDAEMPAIEGQGIVRWIRPQPADSYPAGCGIEFTYLHDAIRSAVIRKIEAAKKRAFIPKG
jgi:CheY-like chemotaxis protein/Tfp pilus assembly protein PilZ